MVWPTESANQVLLQWTPTTTTCKLVYDEMHHYLRIVDATTNHVLDTMDGDDVLGASISIDLKDETTTTSFADPRVVASSASAAIVENPTLDSIPTDTQAQATLTIFVYPRKPPPSSSVVSSIYRTCRSALYFKTNTEVAPTPSYERPSTFDRYGARYAHARTLMVSPVEDLTHVRVLVRAIQTLARTTHHGSHRHGTTTTTTIIPPAIPGTTDQPLHYVIICNPISGPNKNATKIAQEQVIPMLQQAHIETTLCVTTHPGHAVELCHLQSEVPPSSQEEKEDDITAPHRPTTLQRLPSDIRYFHGIVVMGGDGTMHEVIQGIRNRPDATQILSTIPIGIIGCGTANGLAASLTYTSYSSSRANDDDDDTTTTTTRPYDFTYQGITDDIFAIAKGYTIQADLSTYSILESTEPPAIKEYTSFLTFAYGLIAEIDIESERIHWMGSSRFDVWAMVRVLFLRQYPIKLSYTTETTSSHTALSISDPVPSSWTTIEDKITLFWASQVSHVRFNRSCSFPMHASSRSSTNFNCGFSPSQNSGG